MDGYQHGEGHDDGCGDDPVAGALRALGSSDPGVDVVALSAAARGRSRAVRRRRRTVAGAVAAVAVVVPLGLSQWSVAPPPVRTPAVAPQQAAGVPPEALLDDAAVRELLPSAVADPALAAAVQPEVEPAASSPAVGLCRDDVFGLPATVVAARSAGWYVESTVVQPLRQSVGERVLLFRDGGAREFVLQAREQAGGCAADAPGSATWRVRPGSGVGDDSVTGWTTPFEGQNPQHRVRVVAREGDVVVDLTAEVFAADESALVQRVQALAGEALARAGAGVTR
ncbi:hypothetical protein MO973_45570 [Paenibacillus sp. TRM 82003]|uniref:hypothetical protein n=1 Tax=Kineococcus sp. TRM81007 TaxID=2925831 RepID=UPI001F5988B1|nr:hypothetical protein [Kineococcus sp. TRM81007]MCI2240358.1 hypothetical protein [Kineococcus sp. TRM81007]MCI3927465.1 hypothetical protein [Paenibacillus sp. TRM 82003]